MCSKKVLIEKNKIPGIVTTKPVHLLKVEERDKISSIDELFIDIGAKDEKQAKEYANIGDFAVFSSSFSKSDNTIKAKALDDRIGCAILIDLIKKDLLFDAHFCFVVQEEIGLRGAKTATYQVKPDAAIVIESTTASDILGVTEEKKSLYLGRRCCS